MFLQFFRPDLRFAPEELTETNITRLFCETQPFLLCPLFETRKEFKELTISELSFARSDQRPD
jgi:hypothetical protein